MKLSTALLLFIVALLLGIPGCKKKTSRQTNPKKKQGTQQKTKQRTFEMHDDFVDVVEEAPGADLPVDPLAQYRTGRIEERVRRVPSRIQRGLTSDPDRYLAEMVEFLIAKTDDDFLKVKLIHDWIADNIKYDTEGYFSGRLPKTDWKGTLQGGSSVCDGYSTLFDTMCAAAGIESRKVSGYGRGLSFKLFGEEDVHDSNHAWNAVEIYDEWYLVDTTWNAGHVSGRNFEKRYSTEYLFQAPEQFIYRHFPTESGWQLLDPPLSAGGFKELPYVRGGFFSHGLEFADPIRRINQTSGETALNLQLPLSTAITAHVVSDQGEKIPGRTLLQRNSDALTILASFPRRGNWTIDIFAKPSYEQGPYWSVASIGYQASAGSGKQFAKAYGEYTTFGCSLQQPLYAPLESGATQFSIRVPGVQEVSVVTGGKDWTNLTRSTGNRFTGTVTIPRSGPTRIVAKTDSGNSRWSVLVEY